MPFKDRNQRKLYFQKRRREAKAKQVTTLEGFLTLIGNCPKCKTNPSVFVTEQRIPLCTEHWYALADTDIKWGEPMTEEQRAELLEDIRTHRKVLEGVFFEGKNWVEEPVTAEAAVNEEGES